MRKIISKEETERKEKRSRRIIGIFLLSIMMLSVFGIVGDSIGQKSNTQAKLNYNGINFFNQQTRWIFSKNNFNFSIINSPEDLKNITIGIINPLGNYFGKPLYIYSDDKAVEYELYSNMQSVAFRIQPACLNATKCAGDYPIKTCENNFIIIEKSNETGVTQDQNCLFIRGQEKELQLLTDAFLLKMLEIN